MKNNNENREAGSDCQKRLVRHSSWQDIESAPKDGTNIEGLYGDDVCLIRWAETRRCMLAGIGGGNGYFGAGWEDDYNGLIVDPPDAWREEDWESLPNDQAERQEERRQ